ncbi:deoxyuridine 5'-triphosphate nucleotidohydrolase family protein [Tritrichomonas foetus]|uniref:Deoxyuridine 5'-triphosphate nucleotidohydrolase n=1 Tax=Tritrichomonas foetus TaxID=1144522 RepID=A0A1J4J4P5_9EUKA|nr:deoxyuridine 5'-triphosphate nucleotidohydrolase family protein [Tritrichomonas foetus]|eukprot:OHS94312.1 deoxyuridine 5'-triphosphate nucleotidohydrolase family protein [Tritrichomonas foetus]
MSAEELLDTIASSIKIENEDPIVAVAQIPDNLKEFVTKDALKILPIVEGNTLTWYRGDALYIIEILWPKIQEKQTISLSFAQKYGIAWSSLQKSYSPLQVQKINPDAVIPAKAHPLDTGYDITAIRVVKENFGPGVTLFGTGLIVRPPDGYYVDMVARSSTCKLGWGIANHVGIIDAQYRGELCIPMFKLTPEAKDLELPARVAQIIVRRLELTDIEEVADVGETHRGAGGFGSSGK